MAEGGLPVNTQLLKDSTSDSNNVSIIIHCNSKVTLHTFFTNECA